MQPCPSERKDSGPGETDLENRPMAMGRGEERVRCMGRVAGKLTLPYVNR